MSQGDHTAETPGPTLEAEGDVDEDGDEGQEHRDECAAGDVTGDGRTHLVGGNDTVGVLQRGSEIGQLDVLCVEALEGAVQQTFNLGVHFRALAVVLVLGGDLHLGVTTELLHLNGILVQTSLLCSQAEGVLHGGTHLLCGDALVETNHEGTAAGEVYTIAEALEGDAGDGDHDEGAGDDIGPLLEADEVHVRILEDIGSELVGHGHGLALGDAVVEDDAGYEDGGEHRSDDTDDERGGEALHRTGTEDVEDDTGDEGGELTVDDGAVRVLVTVGHRLGEALAGGKFLLDTLIDNHVGIHGHTQC